MDPEFNRMKVPELKKYLQVRGISVANKRREELLDLCQKAHELAIKVIDEQGDQSATSVIIGRKRKKFNVGEFRKFFWILSFLLTIIAVVSTTVMLRHYADK